jgi:hypothetical protein
MFIIWIKKKILQGYYILYDKNIYNERYYAFHYTQIVAIITIRGRYCSRIRSRR